MTADGELHDHQVRCQPYMLELLMLARVEAGLAPTVAEVSRATGAIIAEIGAASSAVLAAGYSRRHPGVGPLLQVRLNRLTAAADEAIAATRNGDSASLRRIVHKFEALTSAMWTVQEAVREPALARPPSRRAGGWTGLRVRVKPCSGALPAVSPATLM